MPTAKKSASAKKAASKKKAAPKTTKLDALIDNAGDSLMAVVEACKPADINRAIAQLREKFLLARRAASHKMRTHRKGLV